MPPKLAGHHVEEVGRHAARVLLQFEMNKREISYEHLTELLNQLNMKENVRNVRNKIARGTFSAAFFVICLMAMEVKNLQIAGVDDTSIAKLKAQMGKPLEY